ncbi:MAG: hypothetical protein A3G32_04050 [Deltaproteobacteria bacterium RIFCSPLOWO2_12_FULL_40_28]|nr:MAG: hypothetical protein A3C45_06135 [Deltaproteobacteria bacterium RIFCSPHIGHO2_02_FULL_40_28]OGQ20494.1 MAG: hypothetical protein A3E27_01930 [Deltaproteobacteria bacterium RIFCSPHIGHO2_12_FULL_40_32]OGQ41124.1 MAG: hypothetical protein A3I69_08795 [Deltaproteobacteria bacterium RIFCSPLOWO2_02_FULL_40_36]OGQ55104.1 MAG: hypothetical protein A3G32_04050 [Deltaproteobacteria bacterium RIFCSPLOWO2_12_FULL_40_28]
MKNLGVFFFFLLIGCYHPSEVVNLPKTNLVHPRTLFVALDGIDYELVKELKNEGAFQIFENPIPLISTFPSATTIGFTGIFQPLNVGAVPGYESRFYTPEKNKIMGGTPFDVYDIPIRYKYYFDEFRHKMFEKAMMYSLPGLAAKGDLIRTKKALFASNKPIVMTYIGGTDGLAHLSGRLRTKRYLRYFDTYLTKLKKKYEEKRNEPLRIIVYSDHGFHHQKPKTVSNEEIKKNLKKVGLHLDTKQKSLYEIITVKYGLLSSGVFFTPKENRKRAALAVCEVKGIDLVFWNDEKNHSIWMCNSRGESARLDYQSQKISRYVVLKGDPLHYLPLLKKQGLGQSWISEKTWLTLTNHQEYPDAPYRLYDAFFNLVENKAGVMFSTQKDYQFGSFAARFGSLLKPGGHKGTHGGLFWESSAGIAMVSKNSQKKLPTVLRYDELFPFFIPEVTNHLKNHKINFFH